MGSSLKLEEVVPTAFLKNEDHAVFLVDPLLIIIIIIIILHFCLLYICV
jgi:hypothetical protein